MFLNAYESFEIPGQPNANMRAAALYGFDLHNQVRPKPDDAVGSMPAIIFEPDTQMNVYYG
ncbi:hypothetical protein CMEL01_11638 [Colletotrichum melonis]|uniref:Uncharacterized protein n=1 Tax=Colletotrichum melonis TaxID=1209925 RepID=A0AAI9V0W9_9PEZI|nr:hypothetical protein CMEL01_11638 [Colletotrichum melonis]